MSEELPVQSYWKSLGELARNKEYESYLHREFGEKASELDDQVSRKSFLRIMGASIALAGFSACRRPVQKILPYSRQPENVVIGIPLQYATAFPFQDTVAGVLVENNEGRPSKIEGNPDHPGSRGKSSLHQQAAILSLYDPDRSRTILRDGAPATRADFAQFAAATFSNRSSRVLFLSEETSSPTMERLRAQARRQLPNAEWITYEAFGESRSLQGTALAFGAPLRALNHYDRADVVVALDDDFLAPQASKNATENAARHSARRKVQSTQDTLSRVYAVESAYTITGSVSDQRKRLRSSRIPEFTYALASVLAGFVDHPGLAPFRAFESALREDGFLQAMASDLLENRGKSVIGAGAHLAPDVHAAVAAMNLALGNASGSQPTVTYHRLPGDMSGATPQNLAEAARRMGAGEFDAVVIIGGNPAFNAPADAFFSEMLRNASNVVHLSDYVDETSRLANWHVNRAHFLEAWGDGRSFDGTASVIQPQIQPLHGGMSEIEFLNVLLTGADSPGFDLVRQTWAEAGARNDRDWERILHDGYDASTAGGYPSVTPGISSAYAARMRQAASQAAIGEPEGLEITVRPDAKLFDGRYANNGWLMELPDPMTKITWDNVALMSPATAQSLGLPLERHLSDKSAPIVRIEANNTSIEIPAWIQPGHADGSVTLTAGYGRTGIGRVADGVGVDVYPLVSSAGFTASARVADTGRETEIACTQAHHSLEGRDMVRVATVAQYRDKPDFATYESVHGYEVPGMKAAAENGDTDGPISLFDETYGPDYEPQWGMAIDLNACFGCGVCTIACQAENNIPVIGKNEVARRRIMHWIRTDRYFEGDTDNPKVYHQPVPCMHCELAPCEQVCPVAATTHSDDGMNQMTYNRCIGTRYCANNCPFKVRRFNFFNYTKEYLTTGDDPEIIQMAMNPEVTVRFRGVMEKCTYCVQRVNRAKIDTKKRTGSPRPADGTVLTACQQACPADAITFGDLTDTESVVSRTKRNDRNYAMLEELNVRPRTSYLARLRNPNPELETAEPLGHGAGH